MSDIQIFIKFDSRSVLTSNDVSNIHGGQAYIYDTANNNNDYTAVMCVEIANDIETIFGKSTKAVLDAYSSCECELFLMRNRTVMKFLCYDSWFVGAYYIKP